MNLDEVRDLVLSYLTHYGGNRTGRVPPTIVDNMINLEMQTHFKQVKTQHSYWHTRLSQYMDDYSLPSSLYSPYMVKVSDERYYPATYPFVEDAKSTSTTRTRTTEDGTTVVSIRDRWYWILGTTLTLYPAPQEDTGTETSGACTISGSVVTISSGSLGSNNDYKGYLITLGTVDYVILSHTSTLITVDGTPDDTVIAYTIYKLGLQIYGLETPASLTVGSTEDVPGTDTDAQCIAIRAAINIFTTQVNVKKSDIINISGLEKLHGRLIKQTMNDSLNQHPAPIGIQPFNLRSYRTGSQSRGYRY